MIKKLISSTPLVGPAIRRVRREYRDWKQDPAWHIRRTLRRQANPSVVQIGSNDGNTNDPLHKLLIENPGWQALLIEPVPFLFEKLVANYPREDRFKFANVAVAETAGSSRFYHVHPDAPRHIPGLPPWYDQLGSFNRDHITKHLGGALEPFIVAIDVPTLPLTELLLRHGIPRVDLLHVDAEGHDWVILSQLDLNRYKPRAILFEHAHLSTADKQAARKFLADYSFHDLGEDYFCRRSGGRPRLF